MLNKRQYRPSSRTIFSGLCLALMLALFLFPLEASAHTTNTPATGPTLQMNVGFEDDSRLDYWTPVQITLGNDGADFRGTLSATTYTSPFPSGLVVGTILPWSYQEPIILPHGSLKQITMYIPFYESPAIPRGIIATLRNNKGKVVATQMSTPYTLRAGSLLVGILSSQDAGFSPLDAASLPDPTRSIERVTLNASTLPDMAEVLGNFDVIVLDDFTTSTLTTSQLTALQTWVNQGGTLVEIGGTNWQRSLSPLPPALLPVMLHGTATLPAGTHLLPIGSPTIADTGQPSAPDTLQQPIPISTATLPERGDSRQSMFSNIQTVLAAGNTPLIVQAHQGQGIICYLAFDPAAGPLAGWPGTLALWKGLLFRLLGDQILIPGIVSRYSNGPGQLILRGGLLQILQPSGLLPIWELAFLLLGYILLLGPIRLVLIKRLRRPEWNWRIILSGMVAFSLLTYGLAYSQHGASVNSISLIQLNQGGSSAHVTSYFSVLIPGQGNFQIRIPAGGLVQPVTAFPLQNSSGASDSNDNITIALGQHEAVMNLPDSGIWTLHSVVSEEDQAVHGGILSHLALHNGTLIGTVTNTLDTALNDVYILMPHSFAYIGSLAAGQTQLVNIPLQSSTLNAGTTLADQIARDSHLPVPYFPYASSAQPQTDFQRHLAILAALSGEGFAFIPCDGLCSTHAIVSRHSIVTRPLGGTTISLTDNNDPLLLAGAPATLIGWADQPLDSVNAITVNSAPTTGHHDTLVQAPLNIDLSGALILPPGYIAGQVINATGDGVQTTLPGIYTLTTGSTTFEFTLPSTALPAFQGSSLRISKITITQPPIKTGKRSHPDASYLQARLYNWQTGSWDTFPLSQDTSFTTSHIETYISSDGRILWQLANQNASLGALFFGRPILSLKGAVSGT